MTNAEDKERAQIALHTGGGRRAWLLLAFGDERQYAGNLGYDDDPSRVYRYDSFVPNHRQLAEGDLVLLRGRSALLGCAKIERIESRPGTKERLRCPICKKSTLKTRKSRQPAFRCDDGHEFDEPLRETVDCRVFEAHFGDTFVPTTQAISEAHLRAACVSYNGQLAMQAVDIQRLVSINAPTLGALVHSLLAVKNIEYAVESEADDSTLPLEAIQATSDAPYEPLTIDTRQLVMRHIRERRGQTSFRQALRERYSDRCLVTGCPLPDILEAAHISPYLGTSDQHVDNGLLLRADIHTLFDLDLMGIEPDSLTVRFHQIAIDAGYAEYDGRRLRCTSSDADGLRPSRAALESRWVLFTKRCGAKLADDGNRSS